MKSAWKHTLSPETRVRRFGCHTIIVYEVKAGYLWRVYAPETSVKNKPRSGVSHSLHTAKSAAMFSAKHQALKLPYHKRWYLAHRDRRLAEVKAWTVANKAWRSIYEKQYKIDNKDKIRSQMRSYYIANAESERERAKRFYYANRESINARRRNKRALVTA